MEIRTIRYFLAVAETGSFSLAAQRLNVAQPAVSRQLQAMEQELGQALIVRSSKGATLTAFGEAFFARFRQLVDDHDDVIAAAKSYRSQKRQRFEVGLPPTCAEDFGSVLLELAQGMKPACELVFVEGLSRFLNEWLADRRIDFAITSETSEDAGLVHLPLSSESMALLLPEGHALTGAVQEDGTLPLQALDHEPLVLSTTFYRLVRRHAAERGVTLRCAVSVDSISATRQIICDKGMATILPIGIARREAFDPRLRMIQIDPPPVRPLYLGLRRGDNRPALKTLQAALVERLRG